MESFSNIQSTSIISSVEGNNDLLITGYNSLLANDDTWAARDYYLLLMVYVNYFCIPVIFFVLKGSRSFENGAQSKFSERAIFVCIANAFFVEDKKYISKLPSSQKEQVEFNFLSRNSYRKTVLL